MSVSLPIRAAEPDEPATDEIQLAQAEPDQTEPAPEKPEAPEAPGAAIKAPEGVEVMTVKGVREIATEVPTSITQFDMKELSVLGAQSVTDLARVTPNLEIKSLTATTPTFFIRGVGLNDFSANAAGAVAIYNDDVPINAPAIQVPLLFDVENVDVLRGPQAFDDNRNASGGAIRTRSHRPNGQYEAYLRADYGNYNAMDYEGALSLPIYSDWLSSRFAFRLSERDPFYLNRCGGLLIDPGVGENQRVCNEWVSNGDSSGRTLIPPGLPRRVNDRSRWAARGLLRLQPPDSEQDWLLNLHRGRLNENAALGQAVGVNNGCGRGLATSSCYTDPDILKLINETRDSLPPSITGPERAAIAQERVLKEVTRDIEKAKPFENDYNLVGNEHLEYWGTSLRGEFPLGPVRATTITGTERWWRRRDQDFDFTSNPSITPHTKDEGWQATENLGFELEPDWFPGTLHWGGWYLREHLKSKNFFDLQLSGIVPLSTFLDYSQDYDSAGVFGNFSWDFLDDFTLDGGVRYNFEHKEFETVAQDQNRLAAGNISQPVDLDKTWKEPTGGINLTYYFTRDITAYGKYTRGWKGGHIQGNSTRDRSNPAGGFVTAVPTVANPETIDAFEIGSRGRWLSDRIQLGGSLFYYRYEDYQVFVIENNYGSNPTLKIINANNARLYGAEADFALSPLRGSVPRMFEGLLLTGRFGWIESEFLDFTDSRSVQFTLGSGQQISLNSSADYTGNRLPNTPRYKVSGTVEWTFDFGRFGSLIPRYDISWTDDIFFDPSNGRGVADNPFFGGINLPDYAIGQKNYALHDVRLTYRLPNSKVEVAFWVRNVEDKVYKVFVSDTTVAFKSLQNLVGDPRTYGGSLSIFF